MSLPATGAIFLAPGFLPLQAQIELNRQFSTTREYDKYDVIVNGAGLMGYFAAIHAAKKGKRILIVDKRTSPGFEIAAKKKLWIGAEGWENLSEEMLELLLPYGEKQEIDNPSGVGPRKSKFGNELMLFSGSIRKGLLRNLLLNKIDVLLMTEVAGIFSRNKEVAALLLASKHGMHSVKCKSFVDATDNVTFSRNFFGKTNPIREASFVAEIDNVNISKRKSIAIPSNVGLNIKEIILRPGKHFSGQAFIEFCFPPQSQQLEEIEQQARHITALIGRNFSIIDDVIRGAKISQFAQECSLHLTDITLPVSEYKGHYLLHDSFEALTCKKLTDLQAKSKEIIDSIEYLNIDSFDTLFVGKANIPKKEIKFEKVDDIGFTMPLEKCIINGDKWLKIIRQCQVLVAGAGTAGAMAGQGSGSKGANTIILDYFNDMGGTKTMGGVMGYYHGVKSNPLFKNQDMQSSLLALEHNMHNKVGYQYFHNKKNVEVGNRFLSGYIICGTLSENNKVTGILACRNGSIELIKAKITIDATGDGDVAAFAGASYAYGNSRNGITQNYSHWDISSGSKKSQSVSPSRDYDIIDYTRISELQRALFLSHYQSYFYDFHPMLGIRESRRIVGHYTLNLFDAIEGTTHPDTISRSSSDYDPHYIGVSEYSRCGFLLPHSNTLVMNIPYRSIVPKDLDGLLISGRGISQTHNALQFTRMSADLLVLGYMTGQIAADIAWNNGNTKDYDVSELQKEWTGLGYIPKIESDPLVDDSQFRNNEIKRRVKELATGKEEYLFKVIRFPKKEVLTTLLDHWEKNNHLLLAKALSWYGMHMGNTLVLNELQLLFSKEQEAGYPDGYVEHYDHIRGREKNVLEGLFWKINQNIAILGMAQNKNNTSLIKHILEHTSSGGDPVNRESVYYQGRLDLRLIPNYNRIFNLCFYAERNPDASLISGFETLLSDANIGGFLSKEYRVSGQNVYGANLEIHIAVAMARCGSKSGYFMLIDYMSDIHHDFRRFASSELKSLLGDDYNSDIKILKTIIAEKQFSKSPIALVKGVEL